MYFWYDLDWFSNNSECCLCVLGGNVQLPIFRTLAVAPITSVSTADQQELTLPVTTAEADMDISSSLAPNGALTSLTPLSTTTSLESMLNEPIMSVAASETIESKIDIIS